MYVMDAMEAACARVVLMDRASCIVDWEGGRIRRECASLEGRAGSCDMHLQRADTCCCSPARTVVSSRLVCVRMECGCGERARQVLRASPAASAPCPSRRLLRSGLRESWHAMRRLAPLLSSPVAVTCCRLDRTAGPGCVIAPTQHPARVSDGGGDGAGDGNGGQLARSSGHSLV